MNIYGIVSSVLLVVLLVQLYMDIFGISQTR